MMTTARITLSHVADLATALQPEARGQAIAASLRQFAEIGGELPLTVSDALAAYYFLSIGDDGAEADRIVARRKTCGEISDLIDDSPATDAVTPADQTRLAAVFRAAAASFAGSIDPRQLAMAATATREADELDPLTAV